MHSVREPGRDILSNPTPGAVSCQDLDPTVHEFMMSNYYINNTYNNDNDDIMPFLEKPKST